MAISVTITATCDWWQLERGHDVRAADCWNDAGPFRSIGETRRWLREQGWRLARVDGWEVALCPACAQANPGRPRLIRTPAMRQTDG